MQAVGWIVLKSFPLALALHLSLPAERTVIMGDSHTVVVLLCVAMTQTQAGVDYIPDFLL